MSKTVVGLFSTYNLAEKAAYEVRDKGLRTADISIIAKESSQNTHTHNKTHNNTVWEGTVDTDTGAENKTDNAFSNTAGTAVNDNISDGVVTGGIFGGLAGLLIGAGSLLIPGFGIVAAAGPITGLISGAVTGGVVGGLVDLGIPESHGRGYESQLKSGMILFSMKTDEDKTDAVARILKNNGATKVDVY